MAGAAVFRFADSFGSGGGESTVGAAEVDGVGVGANGRERELVPRGLLHVREGNWLAGKGAQGSSILEGRRKPPLFAFADGFGIGGGARTTGAAGEDGVGVGAVGREREMDRRGLCHLSDGSWLRRNGVPRQIG